MSFTDDFLGGGASFPAVRFTDVGDKVVGVVSNIKKLEDRDPSGEVKTWQNGDPKHVFVFDLDTEDGTVALWVRGNMVKVIKEAAYAVGVKEMVGSTVAVQFTGLGEAKKGMNAPKLFKAQVKPAPVSTIGVDDLL
jgi:hypothetical protein